MLGKTLTATLLGATAVAITVEAHVGLGLPAFVTVGLPDSAVKESRVRLEAALKNTGLMVSQRRVLINLAPADVRKEGTALDLAIALATMVGFEQLSQSKLADHMFVGELGLDGAVRGVPGVVVFARLARDAGIKALVVPLANLQEARLVRGLSVLGVESLPHALAALNGKTEFVLPPTTSTLEEADAGSGCFSEVSGQAPAKRALLVAATGGHHVLLSGPPGVGKTMLCERFIGLLPDLTDNEQLEVMALHSLGEPARVTRRPPFRAPHHSASTVALIGGGVPPRPGEISLAHRGVLFLDELGEFRSEAINALRQPLESGRVAIARAQRRVVYDAQFQLIAATNPCPCGNAGHPDRACTCSTSALERYRLRLTGPILDRLDLYVNVSGQVTAQPSATSADLRTLVLQARAFAFETRGQAGLNSALRGKMLAQAVSLCPSAEQFLAQAARTLLLSGRALDRTLRVSRSIADLAHSPSVDEYAIGEALAYRKDTPQRVLLEPGSPSTQPFGAI